MTYVPTHDHHHAHVSSAPVHHYAQAAAPVQHYVQAAAPTTATVLVKVPDNAKVFLQDQQMTLSGPVRRFVSPALTSGREYIYTVKVEIEQDGKTLTKTAEARVRAGSNVEVVVSMPTGNDTELSAKVAPIQVAAR